MELYTDGIIQNEYHFSEHDEVLTVRQTQPSEQLIMDRNAELRLNPGARRDLTGNDGKTWGRHQANIPNIIYHKVIAEGKYDLSTERGIQEWLNGTKEGRACLVS